MPQAAVVDEGIERELRAGRLVELTDDAERYLMLAELDRAEATIAGHLSALAAGEAPWQVPDLEGAIARSEAALRVALAPSQRDAIALAIRSKVLVITGGPGTGKTTLVRGILAALDARPRVALAAPTGRAARRLAESTGREARTLHRLLEADPERGFRRIPRAADRGRSGHRRRGVDDRHAAAGRPCSTPCPGRRPCSWSATSTSCPRSARARCWPT